MKPDYREFAEAGQWIFRENPRNRLRRLVSDVAKLEVGLRGKAKRAKFDYVNGGRKAWLAKVDGQRLDVLTPEAVNAWRNQYVARVGSDPVARKSAERSAASYLRCARSLFTADVLSMLRVKLPPNPFAGVKLKDPGPQRYHSEINPEWLLACTWRGLRWLFRSKVVSAHGQLRAKVGHLPVITLSSCRTRQIAG